MRKKINKAEQSPFKVDGVVVRNGQDAFSIYTHALRVIEPKLIEFAKRWESIEDIAGPFSAEWLRAAKQGVAWARLRSMVSQRAPEKSRLQVQAYLDLYNGLIEQLEYDYRGLSSSIKIYLADERTVPVDLRTLSRMPDFNSDGFLDLDKYLDQVRPEFDEVLTDPSDIEYYQILNETAVAIEKLIREARKRNLGMWGSSYASWFAYGDDGSVTPKTDNLKHALTLSKPN